MPKKEETQHRFKYSQLYEILVNKIASGEWKPDECIPTERELCQRYNLSRITVRDALNMLVKNGYIYRIQGKGTFVSVRPIERKLTKLYTLRENIRAQGYIPHNKILSFKKLPAKGKVQDVLQLPEGGQVYELIRCLYASDIPYAVETSYIPCSLYPDMTAELIHDKGLYKTMQSFNIIPEHARETLTAVPFDPEDALLLGVAVSDTAIRNERTTFSKAQIIEYTTTMIKTDFFSYTIDLD